MSSAMEMSLEIAQLKKVELYESHHVDVSLKISLNRSWQRLASKLRGWPMTYTIPMTTAISCKHSSLLPDKRSSRRSNKAKRSTTLC
jgi:hypothetical protein